MTASKADGAAPGVPPRMVESPSLQAAPLIPAVMAASCRTRATARPVRVPRLEPMLAVRAEPMLALRAEPLPAAWGVLRCRP